MKMEQALLASFNGKGEGRRWNNHPVHALKASSMEVEMAQTQKPQKEKAPTVRGTPEPVGLDHIGDDDAAHLPDEEIAIDLPIEQNDFNAQTR
jgi:hypothetical protein